MKQLKALAAAMLLCMACLVAVGCGDALSTTEQARDDAQQAAQPETSAAVEALASRAPAENEVAVIFDTANAVAYNAKFPKTLGSFIVPFAEGDTVYDALVKTGVAFETRGRNYISSIGGIAEKACGANSGWLYLVDGVQPAKSANAYKLEGGETVLWAYTVTQGDVEGAAPMSKDDKGAR